MVQNYESVALSPLQCPHQDVVHWVPFCTNPFGFKSKHIIKTIQFFAPIGERSQKFTFLSVAGDHSARF